MYPRPISRQEKANTEIRDVLNETYVSDFSFWVEKRDVVFLVEKCDFGFELKNVISVLS